MKDMDLDTIKRLSRLVVLVFLVYLAYESLSAQAVPITFHLNDVLSTSTTGPWMFEHDDPGFPKADLNCYTPTPQVFVNGMWVSSENFAYRHFLSDVTTTSSCIAENLAFVDGTDGFRIEFDQFTLTGFHKVNTVNPNAAWNVGGQAGDIREYTGGIGRIYLDDELVLTVRNCRLEVETPYPTAQQMRDMFWDLAHMVINWQQEVGTGLPVTASGHGEIDVRPGFSDPDWVAAFANPQGNQVDFVMSTINYVIQGPTGRYDFDLGIKAAEVEMNNAVIPVPLPLPGNLDFGAYNLEMNFAQAISGGAGVELRDVCVTEMITLPDGIFPPIIQRTLPHYWQLSTNLESFNTELVFDLTGHDLGSTESWTILRRVPNSDTWIVYGNSTVIDAHTIRANAVEQFSDWTVGSTEEPTLPVELSSFDAVVNQSGLVTLNWITQSETGVLGYDIYRSDTAQVNDALRVNASVIEATNSSQVCHYRYTDTDNTENGTWNYWLYAIDTNGYGEFFGPVSVVLTGHFTDDTPEPDMEGFMQLTSYPNPFNPLTTISFYLSKSALAEVAIYNLKGEKVRQYPGSAYASDWSRLTWNGTDNNGKSVASGMYYIKLQTADKILTKKIILTK